MPNRYLVRKAFEYYAEESKPEKQYYLEDRYTAQFVCDSEGDVMFFLTREEALDYTWRLPQWRKAISR